MMNRWIIISSMVMCIFGTESVDAASKRSRNFIVQAPTQDLANEFAKLAEKYRQEKSTQWLGSVIPDWPQPCPLRVNIADRASSGATEFIYRGNSIDQKMVITGRYERLKDSVLPHEITHTIFAHHFKRPVPRWADEGGSVYSEDDLERDRHDRMCRQILNAGDGIRLQRLFQLTDYPRQVEILYAQGYSITRFLVESSNQQVFLDFVAHGMSDRGWNDAVRTFYRYKNVDELEKAWIAHLTKTGGRSAVAKTNTDNDRSSNNDQHEPLTTRESIRPANLQLAAPLTARAAAPGESQASLSESDNTSGWSFPPVRLSGPDRNSSNWNGRANSAGNGNYRKENPTQTPGYPRP